VRYLLRLRLPFVVTFSQPSFIPGKSVSEGWSKLCHKNFGGLLSSSSLRTKLPVSKSCATTLVAFVVVFVDQIMLLFWLRSTRFPSFVMVNLVVELVLLIGLSRLATQTTVFGLMVLNQIPR